MLIGMASKNAILIVEFANQLHKEGLSLTKAVTEACRQRLRPILMTAISAIVGALPLLLASGAGAAARQSLGTAIVGGMVVATGLSLFVIPVLYIVIKSAEADMRQKRRQPILAGGDHPSSGPPDQGAPRNDGSSPVAAARSTASRDGELR
jgi:hydrophobic/amphiphilic exporter-1 (mainly G- bacteria), HAE1 family